MGLLLALALFGALAPLPEHAQAPELQIGIDELQAPHDLARRYGSRPSRPPYYPAFRGQIPSVLIEGAMIYLV